MAYEERKPMGLRWRITAWITGFFMVMALFFFAFIHHHARSVYLGVLDAALLTWGEPMIQGGGHGLHGSESGHEVLHSVSHVPHLSMGFFREGPGTPESWDVVGDIPPGMADALENQLALLVEAKDSGQPVYGMVVLKETRYRVVALPPLGPKGHPGVAFSPVVLSSIGAEGLGGRFGLSLVLFFLVVVGGGYFYSWLLVRPVELLRDVSEKIAEGSQNEDVTFTGSAEFVSLSHSINRMRRAISEKIGESEVQNQALMEKGDELVSTNRELERSIFKANQMMAEAEIRSYELEHEVVQRRQAEEALRSSEEKYRTIVETMKEGYCEVNRDGHVVFVNSAMCEITGYDQAEIVGMYRGQFIAEDSREEVLAKFASLLDGSDDIAEFDYPILRKDGQRRHIGVSVSVIRNTAGDRSGYRTIVRDVEARKRYEEELIYMAYHDSLTGLKNRKGFYGRLDADITRAKRYGGRVVLLYIDIDRFKEVNDTLGHEAGDRVLQKITHRLVANLRKCDCVARVGGDEFAVVLADENGSDAVLQKLLVILAAPYGVGEEVVDYVSGSIGVAVFPDDAVTANDLIQYADSAMYAVKRGKKCQVMDCLCNAEEV